MAFARVTPFMRQLHVAVGIFSAIIRWNDVVSACVFALYRQVTQSTDALIAFKEHIRIHRFDKEKPTPVSKIRNSAPCHGLTMHWIVMICRV